MPQDAMIDVTKLSDEQCRQVMEGMFRSRELGFRDGYNEGLKAARALTASAPVAQPVDPLNEITRLYAGLHEIHDLAHNASTGPTIPDEYWNIRAVADRLLSEDWGTPAPSASQPQAAPADSGCNCGSLYCGEMTIEAEKRHAAGKAAAVPAPEPAQPHETDFSLDKDQERQLAAAAQPEPQEVRNIREKLFQFREWFINDTRESLKDGLLHLNDLDRLEEKFDELEMAVLPRIVNDGKEFLRFERDPNNGANLHAVFFGDRPLHHFRADQNVTQYMADIQRNLDEYLALAAHNGDAK